LAVAVLLKQLVITLYLEALLLQVAAEGLHTILLMQLVVVLVVAVLVEVVLLEDKVLLIKETLAVKVFLVEVFIFLLVVVVQGLLV
jgi:hypothetical protein